MCGCEGMGEITDPKLKLMVEGAKEYMKANSLSRITIACNQSGDYEYCEISDVRLGNTLSYRREIWNL